MYRYVSKLLPIGKHIQDISKVVIKTTNTIVEVDKSDTEGDVVLSAFNTLDEIEPTVSGKVEVYLYLEDQINPLVSLGINEYERFTIKNKPQPKYPSKHSTNIEPVEAAVLAPSYLQESLRDKSDA